MLHYTFRYSSTSNPNTPERLLIIPGPVPVRPARTAPQAAESSVSSEVQTVEIEGLNGLVRVKGCSQFPQCIKHYHCGFALWCVHRAALTMADLSASVIIISQHMIWHGIIG